MSRDPRIDAYIDNAQSFARPILGHVRERVHAIVPETEETLKWSTPSFMLNGKILLMMAAFKQHAALNFWRGQELDGDAAKPIQWANSAGSRLATTFRPTANWTH